MIEWNTIDDPNPPRCPFCSTPLIWDGWHDVCPNDDCDFLHHVTLEEVGGYPSLFFLDAELDVSVSDNQLSLDFSEDGEDA